MTPKPAVAREIESREAVIQISFGPLDLRIRGKRAVRWTLGAVLALASHVGYTHYKVFSLQAQVENCKKAITQNQGNSSLSAQK